MRPTLLRVPSFIVAFLMCLGPLGCSNDEVPISTSPTASALKEVPAPSAPPPSIAREALAAASATAIPSSVRPAPSSSSVSAAKVDASAPIADAGGPTGCGTKPLPDCPLQGWMKANSQAPLAAGDLAALGDSFDAIVKFAPAGYTNWTSISKDGAQAARGGNLEAAKAACRACHEQYKSKYKTEMRERKL